MIDTLTELLDACIPFKLYIEMFDPTEEYPGDGMLLHYGKVDESATLTVADFQRLARAYKAIKGAQSSKPRRSH